MKNRTSLTILGVAAASALLVGTLNLLGDARNPLEFLPLGDAVGLK